MHRLYDILQGEIEGFSFYFGELSLWLWVLLYDKVKRQVSPELILNWKVPYLSKRKAYDVQMPAASLHSFETACDWAALQRAEAEASLELAIQDTEEVEN